MNRAPVCRVALLLIDLDHFKEINDTFGHQYGDLLLQQLRPRLRATLRQSDTVARLDGDEFAVLLPSADSGGACLAAGKLLVALEQPFEVDGESLHIGASVGIALFPDHGEDAQALLRRADVAMYVAKRASTGYCVYAPEQDEHSPRRLALMGELRQAIETGQLLLHYQPKLAFKSGCIHSVEALVRWQHPRYGFSTPDQFVPLAEHSGMIKPMSQWVLNEALRRCREWIDAGRQVQVAVNLSARTLHDAYLIATIAESLARWRLDPSCLEVEVTESAIMADPKRSREILTRIHDMGVRIAIDDFGAGYSSLSYLKKLPVDEIKIDKSFVLEMTTNGDDVIIARSVIDLGHNLGLQVVAEGAEDRQTWDMLASMGCDLAQGYYLSPPVPASELMSWLDLAPPEALSPAS